MKLMRMSLVVIVGLVVSLAVTNAFAQMKNDSILSQHIKEADGTSGQNTNAGSGIKMGHIQDGAVTDPKITGPISAAKISSTGLNADTVDGKHAADLAPAVHTHPQYQQKYGNVAVVAQTGGDFTDPVAAIAALGTWCGTPSAINPCLIKIMPGVYNVGTAILQMRSYVDMEGSGESTTRITGTGGGPFSAVIGGDTNSEIRSLTVENNGAVYNPSCACTQGTGIVNYNAASNLSNVSVIVSGATEGGSYGIRYINSGQAKIRNATVAVTNSRFSVGIGVQDGSNIILKNVSVSASCRQSGSGNAAVGIANDRSARISVDGLVIEAAGYDGAAVIGLSQSDSATAFISNAKIDAYGVAYAVAVKNQTQSSVKINNSSLAGNYPVENYGNAYISSSELEGTINQYYGTLKCLGVYDGNYNPVTCP